MATIILYFDDRTVRFTGDAQEIALQIANASLYPAFVSYDAIPTREDLPNAAS